ncbi:hypothetical protein V6N13_073738 [Hibiscus sabdariffa]
MSCDVDLSLYSIINKSNSIFKDSDKAQDLLMIITKKMIHLLQRANIQEDEVDTWYIFFGGLNEDIIDELELKTYANLDEAVQEVISIKSQLLREANSCSWGYSSFDKGTSQPSPFQSPTNT